MVVQPEAGQLLELEFVGGLCLTILNTIHYEQNLGKIYGPLVVLVDVFLLIDIVSDLIRMRKAMKAEKNTPEVIDEEETAEPEPVME